MAQNMTLLFVYLFSVTSSGFRFKYTPQEFVFKCLKLVFFKSDGKPSFTPIRSNRSSERQEKKIKVS